MMGGKCSRQESSRFKEVIPELDEVGVFDINPDAMKRYKADFEKELGININIASSVEEAVNGKDMILTATQRLKEPQCFHFL